MIKTLCASVLAASVLVLSLSLAPALGLAADGFVPGVADLPLMPGMIAGNDGGEVTFDSPEGRIVDVTAQSTTPWAAIRAFYDETLQQLGWQVVGNSASGVTYQRDAERLLLEHLPDSHTGRRGVVIILVI